MLLAAYSHNSCPQTLILRSSIPSFSLLRIVDMSGKETKEKVTFKVTILSRPLLVTRRHNRLRVRLAVHLHAHRPTRVPSEPCCR